MVGPYDNIILRQSTMNERIWIIGIFMCTLHSVLCVQNELTREPAKKGPYKAQLFQFRNCSKMSLPPAQKQTIMLSTRISNKTGLMHGNITIVENGLAYLKLKVELFILENDQWNLIWRAPGWNCNRQIIGYLLTAMKVNFNRKKCSMVKGVYHFRNMNVDTFGHLCIAEIEYGQMMMRAEVIDNKYTHLCKEFEGVVTPL